VIARATVTARVLGIIRRVGLEVSAGQIVEQHLVVDAGGWFTTAINSGGASVSVNRIARWNGNDWNTLGSGMNNGVYALSMSGGDLYAGGSFTSAGGKVSPYVAKAILGSAPSIITTNRSFGITNGVFGFGYVGSAGQIAVVETSTNLLQWTGVKTNTFESTPLYFTNSQWSKNSRCFYRIRLK
jgi:hypothetical protein